MRQIWLNQQNILVKVGIVTVGLLLVIFILDTIVARLDDIPDLISSPRPDDSPEFAQKKVDYLVRLFDLIDKYNSATPSAQKQNIDIAEYEVRIKDLVESAVRDDDGNLAEAGEMLTKLNDDIKVMREEL